MCVSCFSWRILKGFCFCLSIRMNSAAIHYIKSCVKVLWHGQAADSDTSVLTKTFLNSHCIFISFVHGQISRTHRHCTLKSIHLQTWKKQSNEQFLLTVSSLAAGYNSLGCCSSFAHYEILVNMHSSVTRTIFWWNANCKQYKKYPHTIKSYNRVPQVTNFNEWQMTQQSLLYLHLADMSCPNYSSITLQPVQLIFIMGP